MAGWLGVSASKTGAWPWLTLVGVVVLAGHAVYMYSLQFPEEYAGLGLLAMAVCVLPLIALALWDCRAGLLLSIVLTPFLLAPNIQHFFSHGLGDVLAVATVVGFVLRYGAEMSNIWAQHSRLYALLLIPGVAAISLTGSWLAGTAVDGEMKKGLAEVGGLILAANYAFVLAIHVKDEEDVRTVGRALFVAAGIAVIHGLTSVWLVSTCAGGPQGTIMTQAGQLYGGFGNPNYFASYLLTVMPAAMWWCWQSRTRPAIRWPMLAVIALMSVLVLMSLSRAAMLGLGVVVVGGYLLTRFTQGAKPALLVILVVLSFWPAAWQYRSYSCCEGNGVLSYLIDGNVLSYALRGDIRGMFQLAQYKVISLQEEDQATDLDSSPRLKLIKGALAAWYSSPWLGVGPAMLPDYISADVKPNRAHNLFLTVLAEQGLVGLLVWLMIWYMCLRVLAPSRRGGISRMGAVDYRPALLLSFVVITFMSLFLDQLRSIWVWQAIGLSVASYTIRGPVALAGRSVL